MATKKVRSSTQPWPRRLGALFLLSLCWSSILSAQESEEIRIRYIAPNLIYLDAGRNKGLAKDDLLSVLDGAGSKGLLRVVSVARQTASCEIIEEKTPFQVGDIVVLEKKAETEESAPVRAVVTDKTEASAARPAQPVKDRVQSRISGTLSLQYFGYFDQSEFGRDLNQPGVRLNIRGKNLWGKDYHFRVRTRTRYTSRDVSATSSLPETEWRNRVYEASFRYENESSFINYRLGRIISNAFSGVGYIDGGLLQFNLAKGAHVGVFGGTQPEWQHSDLQTTIKKYGAFVQYIRGHHQTGRWESTLAWASELHGSEPNREFATIRNLYQLGGRLHLFQSAEVDINRDWRKDRAGENISLSNLYAYARFQITEGVRVGLSYDDRQNYYTYELRNRDEQYFDDLSRRGVRADLHAKLTQNLRFSGNFGIRKREGDEKETTSYLASLYQRRFFLDGLSLNLRVNGFENPLTEGLGANLKLGKRMGKRGDTLYLGYAVYSYSHLLTDRDRETEWLRLEGYWSLGKKYFFSGQAEYNTGDDIEGYRLFLEMGYRL